MAKKATNKKLEERVQELEQDVSKQKSTDEALQKAQEQSQQHSLELSVLMEGSQAILKNQGFKDAARAIFDHSKNIIGATEGYIELLGENGSENKVLFFDSGGHQCTVDSSLPMPIRGLRAKAYRTGREVYHNNFSNSKWLKNMPKGHAKLDNIMFSPLVLDEKVVGLLGLANKKGGFTEYDAQMASAFGKLAAIALQNGRSMDERRRTEKALMESKERIETILNSMPVGIVIIDKDSKKIMDANPMAILMIGAPIEQIVGMQCHKFICPAEKGKCPITDQSKTIDKSESIILTADGGNVPIHKTVITVTIDDRKCLIESFFDIRDQKRVEHELIEREKLKGVIEMAGAVCHEMNQPMQSISGFSELLLMALAKNDKLYTQISKIKGQVDRMTDITKKLMRITRYETKNYWGDSKIIDIEKSSE